MNNEPTAVLEGTGWQVAVSQNPITGRWHWIAWSGPARFDDPDFVAAYNAGNEQSEETREEAIQKATLHALDKHAGWVEHPMFDGHPEDH